jgi:hypothetical protein
MLHCPGQQIIKFNGREGSPALQRGPGKNMEWDRMLQGYGKLTGWNWPLASCRRLDTVGLPRATPNAHRRHAQAPVLEPLSVMRRLGHLTPPRARAALPRLEASLARATVCRPETRHRTPQIFDWEGERHRDRRCFMKRLRQGRKKWGNKKERKEKRREKRKNNRKQIENRLSIFRNFYSQIL